MEVKGFARVIIVFTTISAAIMELIDTSIVNVALNQMAGNLGATIEDASWVITAYAIANVIIIPMTSFLAQYFGRRNYYLYSIIIFTVASWLCGNSTSLPELVLWRFVQGIGGGALLSTSQSILFDVFPVTQRGMASAIFGMGIVMGPSLGPTVGGIIIDHYNWPLIFNINIPFGIIAATCTYFFIKDSVHHTEKPVIDWLGIVLLMIGIGSLQYVLERGDANDWFDDTTIRVLTVSAIGGLISFVWWQLKTEHPVVNLRLLKNRNLALTTLLTFIIGFVMFTSVFIYPLLLQRVLGFTPTMVGLSILPPTLMTILFMPIVGRSLQNGVSPKVFIFLGFLTLMLYGWMMYVRSDINSGTGDFFVPLVIRSIGISMVAVTLTNQAIIGLSPRDIPQGVALNNMMRQVGGAFGIAIMNTYLTQRVAIHRNDLISNIYSGSAAFAERNNLITGALTSKLGSSPDVQAQAYRLIDLAVSKQAYLLSYLDAFLFSVLFVIAVFPMIFLLGNQKLTAEAQKAASEAAH